MNTMTTPSVEYSVLAPILIVFAVAVAGVLVEAFLPRGARYRTQLTLALAGLAASFVALVGVYRNTGEGRLAAVGAIAVDRPALFLQAAILLISALGVLLIAERSAPAETGSAARGLEAFTAQASTVPGTLAEQVATRAGAAQTEVFPLTMFAVGGMMIFPASGDLLTAFIALEVFSLPLYLMCGLARRRRLLSQEAGLKYFLLGAFSSAFFLYGTALLYGFAGTVELRGIASALTASAGQSGLVIAGTALLMVGLLFKIGAAPFHQWTPDAYQGAPTAITAFMSTTVKIAAFGALLRVLYVAFGGLRWDWEPMLWIVAILTMVVGSVIAVTQSDIKRMLAYSSVAQAGFIMVGVIATSASGLSSVLFYVVAYGFTTIGAFAVISIVRDSSGEATHLSKWAGLGKKSPVTATVLALFMLSFAGIPLTSGFIAKFGVFAAAIDSGATWLVIVAVVASVVSAFFYARVIVIMFFSEPTENTASVVVPSAFTTIVIAAGATVTVVLGVLPQPLLDLVDNAGLFLR